MKEHFISLNDTIEPPKTIHHFLTVEVEEEEFDVQLDETIYSICTFLARGCFDAGSDLCLDCVAWESVDGLPV